ncbi:hypothetical protein DPMN_075571 [Dreissena polymorpha]|uniref:FAS1 domain-containing protein n=1 Tax=Dreissena polymorpha TaxID=45954 RepID=A0A9D4BPJ5_DREPO|nr:hypothetical protein DPMN_075571 [Dreissena polymorpha]
MASRKSVMTLLERQRRLFFGSYNYGDSIVHTVNGAWILTADILASNGIVHLEDRKKAFANSVDPDETPYDAASHLGLRSLLKGISVFWAHTIEDETVYIPRMGTIPNYPANAGILKFYRVGSMPNIPVQNGVIHVIDDLLLFVYRNLRQTKHRQKIRFIQGNLLSLDAEIVTNFTDKTRKMTLFLPIDDAFAKLPQNKQYSIGNNGTHVSRLFRDHLIMYAERDIDSFHDGKNIHDRRRRNIDLVYVEGGRVSAKVTTPDIGCTNGVIHLVNSVLFQRDFTIWYAVMGNNQLSKMKQLISKIQDLMATLGATRNGPMTVFLISDAALNNLPSDTFEHFLSNYNLILESVDGFAFVLPCLYIVGSRIRADVVIEDIWNIVDEMAVQPGLGVMAGILDVIPPLKQILKDTSRTFTMFMPSDQ